MKRDRHAEIIRLIHEYEIDTQEELARRLNESGFTVTQATVSRDIRELKLNKTAGENGRARYALMQQTAQGQAGKFVRVLRDAFVAAHTADNLLVVKTASGMAMAAAAAIDELAWPEIVGSIAGDDTIFCATHSKTEAGKVAEKMKKLMSVT